MRRNTCEQIMSSIEILKLTGENCPRDAPSACDDCYFAHCEGKVLYLQTFNNDSEHKKLEGHHSEITALAINKSDGKTLLASAGSYYIIIWDVDEVELASKSGETKRGKILTTLENKPPNMLDLSSQNMFLCALHSHEVCVYDIDSKSVVWTKSSEANYTKAIFLNESSVISVKNDHVTEVWNCQEDLPLWLPAQFKNSVKCIAAGNGTDIILGFSNNVITSYCKSHKVDGSYTFVKKFDIDLDIEMLRSNLGEKMGETASRSQIISLTILKDNYHEHAFTYTIVCATSAAIFIINAVTQEVEILCFKDFGIDFISSASFSPTSNCLFCLSSSLFQSKIQILQIHISRPISKDSTISVLPNAPLNEDSVLKKTLTPSKLPKKTGQNKSKPLTFHSKIKSSGYNSKPTNPKMFQPVTSSHKIPKPALKTAQKIMLPSVMPQQYLNWNSPVEVTTSVPISENPSNVNHISVSECNRYLSCIQSDSVIITNRKTNKHIATLLCHNGAVSNSFWTNDSNMIISSSADISGKVWSMSQHDKPILNLNNLRGNLSKSFEKIPKEVSHCQFYYMDKFIIMTFGNSFCLYSYHIDNGPKSDVKRYLEKNKYKLINLTSISQAQTITCFAAPNNIYSYVMMACGSDRSLRIFDMNVGSELSQIQGIHTRPAKYVVQSTGSSFAQPASYDIFATSAPSDGVKFWDIRSSTCIAKFTSHTCSGACPFDLTPCGSYMATSGDDGCLHIYDIRKGSLIYTSSQQKERISALSFSKDGRQIHLGLRHGHLANITVAQ